MKQLRSTFLMSVLIGIVLLSFTRVASADESELDFRVAPSAGASVADGGDYFVLSMNPGDVKIQTIALRNWSSEPLDVRFAAVDATTAQMGGVDYAAEQLPTVDTGSWISLEETTVRLAADRSTEVSFEVVVPSDASPGVHLGGLVVWVDEEDLQAGDGSQTSMNVQSRRAIAVQIDVPGPMAPVLEIRGAHAEARPDGLYLALDLFNAGNDFAKGTGTVSIEGQEPRDFALDTVVPATGTNYPFRWSGSSVPNGSYDVAVEIDYGAGIVSWEGEVVVGPAVQSDLRGRGVGEGIGSGVQTLVLVGCVVLLLVAVSFFGRRRWTSRRHLHRPRRLSQPRMIARLPDPIPPVLIGGPPPAPIARRELTRAGSAAFVPRSEDAQRRVPPPPPPPLAGRAPAPPPSPFSAEDMSNV